MCIIKNIKKQYPIERTWEPYVGDDGIYAPMIFDEGVYDQLIITKEMLVEAYNKWIKDEFAPVVHAQWQDGHGYIDCVDGDPDESYVVPTWICSNCKSEEELASDYCPNCGAKMDLED